MKTVALTACTLLGLCACTVYTSTSGENEPDEEATSGSEQAPASESAPTPAESEPVVAEAPAPEPQPESQPDTSAQEPEPSAKPSTPVTAVKAYGVPKPNKKKPVRGSVPKPATPALSATTPSSTDAPAQTPGSNAATSTPTTPSDQRIVERIEVRAEGTNVGVVADIERVDPGNHHEYFARTEDSGVVKPGAPCKHNDRFEVKPTIAGYLSVDLKACAATIAFEVPTAQAVEAMMLLADDASNKNLPGLAQLYYEAAAKRWSIAQPEKAKDAQLKANAAAARALGLDIKGELQNQEMIKALRQYQIKTKLPITGKLDPQTQKSLSGIDETEAVKRANAVPADKLKSDALQLNKQRFQTPVAQPNPAAEQKLERKQAPVLRPEIMKQPILRRQ